MAACSYILLLIVNLTFTLCCPTWFRAGPGIPSNPYCECGSSLGGAIQCDNVTKEVSIVLQYTMTHSNISGKEQLIVGFTNTVFLRSSSRVYTRLPSNVSDINDFMCTNSKKKGILCGECVSGYGYAANSYNNECAKCNTAYDLGMFLLFVIFPITICFFLIVLLRINIPSGFLLGYILFCQMIVISMKSYTVFYYDMLDSLDTFGKFNLKLSMTLAGLSHYFIGVYYSIEPTCIHYSLTQLQVLFIEYTFCLYPLILLFVTWLCIELHAKNFKVIVLASKPFSKCLKKLPRNWSISDCVIRVYATFYFLSFLHLVYLSYSVVRSVKMYDMNFKVVSTGASCEPTMEWFGSQHLTYAIPALILLLILGVLPSLILCQQSTRVFRKCFTFRSRTQLMIDTFVESFASCYKDGFNDTFNFRFLSSMPMIAAFCMFSCFPSVHYQSRVYVYILFSLIFLLFALFISFFKPYKSNYMNISLSFHSTVVSLCIMLVILWFIGPSDIVSSRFLATLFIFFTLLPHVVAVITIVYHCLYFIPYTKKQMKFISGMLSSFFKPSAGSEMSLTSNLPDRLENSFLYRM